ncbi:Crp/Fnr family transcriptional regulator [Microcystis aeruginosa CS-567/02-A1]|uniref:Crp/Fnr family transcriptional regulator n=1 Tax=Microcystis aeruginosa TaxID=1126 RepID=UPI000A964874|nr:Crp/Fnr family transcriptional regulator [Microcystis aeruginosa]MDB9399036.1 Crp/Fnr family transcriptional regulator [Microcystis aeruginosa CS-567/02-A1]
MLLISTENNALESRKNRLLAALPDCEYERLIPHLKPVELTFEKVLIEPEETITDVYFPYKAVVSLITIMESGFSVEVGIVSNEGMVGIPIILGGNQSTTKAIVQVPDSGWQMKADVLKSEFDRGGVLQNILLRYFQTLYTQVSQGAACNRLHTLEQRLARWLLTVSDGMESDDFPLTQEFIAQMLGVRRSGVTVAAKTLSQEGIIHYIASRIARL